MTSPTGAATTSAPSSETAAPRWFQPSQISFLLSAVPSAAVFAVVLLIAKVSFFMARAVGAPRIAWVEAALQRRHTLVAFVSATAMLLAAPADLTALTLAAIVVRITATLFCFAVFVQSVQRALEIPSSLEEALRDAHRHLAWRWVCQRLKRPVDVLWFRWAWRLFIIGLPAAVGIVALDASAAAGFLYCASVFVSLDRFNSLEHINSHYKVFTSTRRDRPLDRWVFRAVNAAVEFVLCPMLARIPRWYAVQHVVVHHVEDNGRDDTQTTLRYDRASFLDCARCANKFALSGLLSVDVMRYLVKRRRHAVIGRLLGGMMTFYGLLAILAFWSWRAALVVTAVRYGAQCLTTLGFFQEHGMVDTSSPSNIYRNSIHYISADNPHASLGEDAHISHHLQQGRHWSEYANAFSEGAAKYADERALGFIDGADHLRKYYAHLWRRDYYGLAALFVVIGQPHTTRAEVAELLRARTRPEHSESRPLLVSAMDQALGTGASWLLP